MRRDGRSLRARVAGRANPVLTGARLDARTRGEARAQYGIYRGECMRMRTILLAAAALGLGGCTQLSLDKGKRLAAQDLPDAGAAQFRGLTVRERHVCGQMNVRDRLGQETGFKGFIVDLESGRVIREPDLEPQAQLTPFEHSMARLDQGVSVMKFSSASFQLCGHSVASSASEATQTISRHVGMAVIPRLDDERL